MTQDEKGLWRGQGERAIPLKNFEVKSHKSSHSIAIKLLHKAENVAADIFDRIGVRFITPTRLDCVRVIRYLRERNVIMFANVKPSRSRNTLIDLDRFRARVLGLQQRMDDEDLKLNCTVGRCAGTRACTNGYSATQIA